MISVKRLASFCAGFCAVFVHRGLRNLKPPYLVEPSGIEPLTSTLPVLPAQKYNSLIINAYSQAWLCLKYLSFPAVLHTHVLTAGDAS